MRPLINVALTFFVNLRHEGAGGVENRKAANLRVVLHGPRYPVRAEDRDCACRYLGEILNEASAFCFEAFNDIAIVHDLVAHINRRSMFLKRPFHDIDCADDACTIATRLSEYDLHGLHPVFPTRALAAAHMHPQKWASQ